MDANDRMPFGKYKGVQLKHIPDGFLRYYHDFPTKQVSDDLKIYLRRRLARHDNIQSN